MPIGATNGGTCVAVRCVGTVKILNNDGHKMNLATADYNGLANRRLQPLGHLSVARQAPEMPTECGFSRQPGPPQIAQIGANECGFEGSEKGNSGARPIQIISLGAGVQSTTMALMAAHGEIAPMPDCAIFADTGWEPRAVYEHLQWLMSPNVLPFPVHVVSAGNLRADTLARSNTTGGRFAAVPWFMVSPRGKTGMGRRQCTKEYKLRPVQRKVVELLGGKRPKGGAEVWIGISQDEALRRKPSRVQYIVNRFPLLELSMRRRDCLTWLQAHGYLLPPKSSCIGCPFHDDAQWRALTPEEFADAVEVDRAIRNQPKMRGTQYMHRSLVPLDQVDLSTPEERGQLNMFINECEGMCGV